MRILAIETSCDETAAAVVEAGRHVHSNVVATQIDLHRRYGGVFPEVASRQHVLSIQPVIEQALHEAQVAHVRELDAIAVTQGPGLAGSLLVGVNAAKGLAFASGLPLLPVNHLEGHVYSNWIEMPGLVNGVQEEKFPILVMIVSGGHTEMILMRDHGKYEQIGATLDDAAGEAFDKVARLLDLGFPGGPAIQKAAEQGNASRFPLPRALRLHDENRFNFSFSGLKTAVLNLLREVQKSEQESNLSSVAVDIAASFQVAVVDQLLTKLVDAAQVYRVKQVCICGGVSANAGLRSAAKERVGALQIPLYIPPLALCTDNAAMIGAAAYFRWKKSERSGNGLEIDVIANLSLT